ncbi:OmpA family protein [Reyranella sp. CPCC 100927]|uniref:OmpA family protein n=1 Tax=Reyranella sp. CPCC 100927 TaxID=2599616 RepID=UPI0011B51EE1|nr:OmpA family protein [Reyranella sp. CPCC 100927]TWT10123.1 OmpA family protein [Reyranella sp. CPCC 100927]
MRCRSLMAVLPLLLLLAGPTLAQRPEPPLQPRADEPPSYVVFFDMGKATVAARGVATIREAAAAARRPGVKSVEVNGYTDRAGTDRSNEALALRRARAVRDLLVKQGVSQAIISIQGLGETKPFMATEDGANAPENRRAEIIVK